MNPIEPLQALLGYGFLLFFPGYLWTFLSRTMSTKIRTIERIILTAGISISALPLALYISNRLFGLEIDIVTVLFIALIIGFLPLFIRLIWSIIFREALFEDMRDILIDAQKFIENLVKSFKRIPTSKVYLVLLGILILGAFLTLLPHVGYFLPLHTDEWHYMAYSDRLIFEKEIVLDNVYYNMYETRHWEIGFLLFLAPVKMMSGASWPFIFSTLPTVIFSLIILTAYSIGEKFKWGLYSALIVALVPSTVRFLGPVFLVPVTLGLFLVPLGIFITLRYKEKYRYLILIMIGAFTFIMHPPSGAYLFLALMAICVVFALKREWMDSAILASILVVGVGIIFIFPISNMYNLDLNSLTNSSQFFLPTFELGDFLRLVAFIPVLFFAIGVGTLVREKSTYNLGLLFAIAALFGLIITLFYVFPNFYSIQAVYDRAIIHLVVLISIVAGSGLYVIRKRNKSVFAIILVILLIVSISSHIGEPYYHIIDEQEYDDFIWIRDNLNDSYEKAILDPWKAVAFTAITGKQTYFHIPQGPSGNMEIMTSNIALFFEGNSADSDFLTTNGISIVYTSGFSSNPDLIEVQENIYVFNP